ncbi:MAG: GTP pyrophosphokinase family protein [Anaerorhabdus sp.]
MRLELFDFVDKSGEILKKQQSYLKQVQDTLVIELSEAIDKEGDILLNLSSRIKEESSLKEKIIRNKYYLKFNDPLEMFDYIPDIIGVSLECRFVNDENYLYKMLFDSFEKTDSEYYSCKKFPNIYLNLSDKQPQVQKNGFKIYRMDGYTINDNKKVNFELQIKSLVHRFWSEIEHQVVYKNNNFILYDNFMKEILSSIYDNLEVVDRQLETVYQQIASQSVTKDEIGMGENGFKLFIAKSINDLVTIKMNEVVGFATNFKKCSSILSQYIYIKDFVQSEHPQYRMAEYIEHFNLLKITDFDFTKKIKLERKFFHEDEFCSILGSYWESVLNKDYEWHVFFMMVFIIQPGNNYQDLSMFVKVVKTLIFTSVWNFIDVSDKVKEEASKLESILAKQLVKIGKIDIIHEENIFAFSSIFRNLVIDYNDKKINTLQEFEDKLYKLLLNLF